MRSSLFCRIEGEKMRKSLQYFRSHLDHCTKGIRSRINFVPLGEGTAGPEVDFCSGLRYHETYISDLVISNSHPLSQELMVLLRRSESPGVTQPDVPEARTLDFDEGLHHLRCLRASVSLHLIFWEEG